MRMNIEEIRKKYASNAKCVGELCLLRPDMAVKYVDDCLACGYEVQGVEGFSVSFDGAIQPHQKHSNDIAAADLSPAEFAVATKRFICDAERRHIWFEIIVEPSSTMS